MNQIIPAIASLLLLMGGISACTLSVVSTPQPATEVNSTARIAVPACNLRKAVDASACVVEVYDGNTLFAVQRAATGQASIDVPTDSVTGPRIVIYRAPGYVPQIRALKMAGGEDERVTLEPHADVRGGFITGVVFKKADPKMDGGACGIESFMVEKPVVVSRARARMETRTDNIGSFQLELPAGRYVVHAEGQSREVDVPQNDSVFVVIAVD